MSKFDASNAAAVMDSETSVFADSSFGGLAILKPKASTPKDTSPEALEARARALSNLVASYDPHTPDDCVYQAFLFAAYHHRDQKRRSGEPYISHPLSVAEYLAGMRLDHQSVITALLHDTVEDTEADHDAVSAKFGSTVAELVDGVTKLSQLKVREQASKSAENFRKLFLAMSRDIRVLLVKLADRLDNMRTLHHLEEHKRRRIAIETAEIYAPLAERIGLRYIKEELDDIAFQQINPDAREQIVTRMTAMLEDDTDLPERIIHELGDRLHSQGIEAKMSGRVKTPYSIWQKMQRKAMDFEQLSDIMAYRAVVDSVPEAYHALGVLHSEYSMVPGRFKDYISTPKANGYQSIHTGLIGPFRKKIEVQIRTQSMHDQAELGVAAHWQYKQGDAGEGASSHTQGTQFAWVRELLEILDHASSPEEFFEHTKMEMYQDQVFVFSPKGRLIALPSGACIVDFAYAVHTQVGNRCVGGKINGRIRPLAYRLSNGDQVEILTSKNAEPRPDWENFAVTGKAKAQIRRYARIKAREQYGTLGQQMVHKAFRAEDLDHTEAAIAAAARKLGHHTGEDLYVAVAQGNQTIRPIIEAVHPGVSAKVSNKAAALAPGAQQNRKSKANKEDAVTASGFAVPIRGLVPGLAVHMARCCHPIPGDRIVGIITTGKGVTVHTRECDTLETYSDQPERWFAVSWDIDQLEDQHVARLAVVITNEPGSLGTLSTLIGKNGGNITNLKFTNRSHDFFDLLVDVEVKDVEQLKHVIASLRASRYVAEVDRKMN